MSAGQPALGMIVRLAKSPEVILLAKATGHDFVFLDGQHSVFNPQTIADIAHAGIAAGIDVFYRVRSSQDADMSRVLDCGVSGLIVPDVETAEQARDVVAMSKFAPEGKRSVGGGAVLFDYKLPSPREVAEQLNRETLVICMLETAKAIENAEEIAATPGVDVLHIGCGDFLVDIGKPGDFGAPELETSIRKVMNIGKSVGKFVGIGGDRNVARQAAYIRDGASFVTTQNDAALLASAYLSLTQQIRDAVAQLSS